MAEKSRSQEDQLEDVQAELHPHDRWGQNMTRDALTRTAYELKDVHDFLRGLPDSALRQVPVLETGVQLDEGATYFDLGKPEAGEFTGMNNLLAGPDEHLVDKATVDYE